MHIEELREMVVKKCRLVYVMDVSLFEFIFSECFPTHPLRLSIYSSSASIKLQGSVVMML